MAATDKNYRSPRMLDIVFGVSCLLMLVSVVWMFAQDYFREFKVEQRQFRDVETALGERAMLNLIPDAEKEAKIKEAEKRLADALTVRNAVDKEIEKQIRQYLAVQAKAEADTQAFKAEYDSLVSLYNIDVERNAAHSGSPELAAKAEQRLKQLNEMKKKFGESDKAREKVDQKIKKIKDEELTVTVEYPGKKEKETKTVSPQEVIKEAVAAEDDLKRLTADFDRFAKLTVQKEWKLGDRIRSLPVLDAFASPTRIQQYTLDSLPINYNFKYATRYDRCTTCHQGIDRPAYTEVALRELTESPSNELQKKLQTAHKLLKDRRKVLEMQEASFDESALPSTVRRLPLSNARIKEFSAHPRLDLFVDGNSPHSGEKFGCTICHEGQGSATDFYNASHTPNNFPERHRWETDSKHWHSNHYWNFPMHPSRFVEASCLKCHHQITDLLPEGNKVEYREVARSVDGKLVKERKEVPAPGTKVTRGYNLIREFGCFGCHEISGVKGGRWVGPDLRLEPTPAVADLPPEVRAKVLADPLNPPGSMRKVGPSLRRISEKTNEEWVRKWVNDPRGFRPDTKMPHFYNLSNNNTEALPTEQKNFPAAEIHAIAFYLFRKSEAYVAGAKEKLADVKLPADYKEDKTRGRLLFTEKGCLACHSHEATEQAGPGFPAVKSEAHFGPNLSRIAAKLGAKPGDQAARRWLIQWIKDPKIYHPRTYMPVTHLDDTQAADLAAWLLDQKADVNAADVLPPPADDKTYEKLARVWLAKSLGNSLEVENVFKEGKLQSILEADDQKLGEKLDDEGKLKLFIGRKAVNQLGCFGCHDVPGFENAKPIGTPLNDWGKKNPERLAFEDISAYVHKNYYAVDDKLDKQGMGHARKDGKEPYEKFFLELLEHHQREGFLHQKLREPRSYDYERIRTWDERLRMPQFKFARGEATPIGEESAEQAELRAEAEAREAVMTFVLGLIAEPIPLKYVYEPQPERKAEILGKQVLDKFNCAGCHQIRPGSFEFNTSPRVVEGEKKRVVLDELENTFEGLRNTSTYKDDLPFPGHNAWTGKLSANPDRIKAHGLPIGPADGEAMQIKLTQALRFNKPADMELPAAERAKKAVDIPAADTIALPREDLLYRAAPEGGVFTDLLVPFLIGRKAPNLDDDPKARSGLPPPLLREGEKVQPSWLFQFLRNPYKIREAAILRMPRFNMSDEDAMILVNYFAALDKSENPGVVLNYPYLAVPQRDEGFTESATAAYVARLKKDVLQQRVNQLKPIWEKLLPQQAADLEGFIADAKKAADNARDEENKETDPAKKDRLKIARQNADKKVADLQKELANLKSLTTQPRSWEKDRAYFTDAFRLLANNNLCLQCHQVGKLGAQPIGPRLDTVSDRLRPDWTQRWIASPQRMMVYPVGFHPMPQNFPRSKSEFQNNFSGTSLEQATALRDLLMLYPKVAVMPENRDYRPPQGAGQ